MASGDTVLDAAMALVSCATRDRYCSTAISDLGKKDQAAGNVLNSLVNGDAWNAIQTTAMKASQGDQVALENLAGILTGIVVPAKAFPVGKSGSVTEQAAKGTNSLADYVKDNIALSEKARESSNFNKFSKAEGAVQESLGIWPPNRGAYGPVEQVTLPTGAVVDRYGYPGGSFVSPVGVPFEIGHYLHLTKQPDHISNTKLLSQYPMFLNQILCRGSDKKAQGFNMNSLNQYSGT